jgi:hypothetical protein
VRSIARERYRKELPGTQELSSNRAMRLLRTSVALVGMAIAGTLAAQIPDAPAPAASAPPTQGVPGSSSQKPSSANQGGCYDTDKSGKEVFIPNCGLDDVPAKKSVQAPSAGQAPAEPAKQFPFPGEPATAPAAQPAAGQQAPSAAKQFPFPGEASTPEVQPDGSIKPADGSGAGPLKDAGSSGEAPEGSSSSSSSSSDRGAFGGLPADPDKGPLADDDTVIKKPRKVLPKEKVQTADQRADEDLSVASFYMGNKNYRAAYLRAADAVEYAKDDPNAHFALAEAARKLGKLDEALTNYKQTLALDPVPKLKKQAEDAVKQMSGGKSS